jgi:uncharacterized protein YdeI (BOF family)
MPDRTPDREQARRRMPSVSKSISDLGPGDMRVSITGTVVDRGDRNMVLDDGSGRVNVSFESPIEADPNQLVRVFGRVVSMGDGIEVQGEILQDMSRLNKDLYKRINSLK